jgi:hypothetical protein
MSAAEDFTPEEYDMIGALARRLEFIERPEQAREQNRRREGIALRWIFTEFLGLEPPPPRNSPEVYRRVDRGDR